MAKGHRKQPLFPGLLVENLRRGKRYRVRQEGNHKKLTTVVAPSHRDFLDQYHAARAGKTVERCVAEAKADKKTMQSLIQAYTDWLHDEVERGSLQKSTARQRERYLQEILKIIGSRPVSVNVSSSVIIALRDKIKKPPLTTNFVITTLRYAFEFGLERNLCKSNPVKAVKPLKQKPAKGAVPWADEEVAQYLGYWPIGTIQHLTGALMAYTGCRISDAGSIGPRNEVMYDGVKYLEYQPVKKGSSFVSIPMHPELQRAISAMKIVGQSYVLSTRAQAYTANTLSRKFSEWCVEAGLEDKSAHGIRKHVARLLAEVGHSTNEIMAVLGHTKEQTTAIYTKTASRRVMATTAATSMRGKRYT